MLSHKELSNFKHEIHRMMLKLHRTDILYKYEDFIEELNETLEIFLLIHVIPDIEYHLMKPMKTFNEHLKYTLEQNLHNVTNIVNDVLKSSRFDFTIIPEIITDSYSSNVMINFRRVHDYPRDYRTGVIDLSSSLPRVLISVK